MTEQERCDKINRILAALKSGDQIVYKDDLGGYKVFCLDEVFGFEVYVQEVGYFRKAELNTGRPMNFYKIDFKFWNDFLQPALEIFKYN